MSPQLNILLFVLFGHRSFHSEQPNSFQLSEASCGKLLNFMLPLTKCERKRMQSLVRSLTSRVYHLSSFPHCTYPALYGTMALTSRQVGAYLSSGIAMAIMVLVDGDGSNGNVNYVVSFPQRGDPSHFSRRLFSIESAKLAAPLTAVHLPTRCKRPNAFYINR